MTRVSGVILNAQNIVVFEYNIACSMFKCWARRLEFVAMKNKDLHVSREPWAITRITTLKGESLWLTLGLVALLMAWTLSVIVSCGCLG